ncbi:MAG: hypothetical protein HS129_07320 [Leptospiraceae bacterium]|nr:hypothetical protein [Leptospiraceae bacterium]
MNLQNLQETQSDLALFRQNTWTSLIEERQVFRDENICALLNRYRNVIL